MHEALVYFDHAEFENILEQGWKMAKNSVFNSSSSKILN